MLSILIPLHNYDINALTKSLILQAEKTGIDYEIIIVDDFSDMSYDAVNKLVISNKKVKFYKNSNNIGRSQTRNKLADMAVYNNLLFIDCDAEICSENYLKNYINHFKNYKVICGGTDYQHNAPDMNYLLRWKYGVNREKISSIKRNIFPSGSFSGFNFMIKKDVFQNIGFDESIYKYGHEDTLLGIELAKNNIEIKHIDNTLIHKG
ncbi:glycosyltransferase family 2 protein, partial [Bacteroidota bacterium]